jgi:hypothetical protein
MADYIETADNIIRSLTFGHPRNPTTLTPITPTMIAIAKLISPTQFHSVFQFLTQALVFLGMLALAREIRFLTGSAFLALGFCAIVTICRPSIFWSLKISTESVGEALLYISSALVLATLRTRRAYLAFASGLSCFLLGLNRPNYFPGVALVFAAIVICSLPTKPSVAEPSAAQRGPRILARLGGRRILLPGLFLCAFLGLWSIWITRNYRSQGVFLPTSASGYLTMVWDYGGAPIRPGRYQSLKLADGSEFSEFGIGHIIEAWEKLPDPTQRTRFLQMLASAWFAANWMDLPRATFLRLQYMALNRGASGLTTLSREKLYQSQDTDRRFPYVDPEWINFFLLDKTPAVCLLSVVGLALLLIRYPCPGLALAGLVLVPWFAVAIIVASSRAVETLIAFDLWLAFFGIYFCVSHLLRKRVRPQGN